MIDFSYLVTCIFLLSDSVVSLSHKSQPDPPPPLWSLATETLALLCCQLRLLAPPRFLSGL